MSIWFFDLSVSVISWYLVHYYCNCLMSIFSVLYYVNELYVHQMVFSSLQHPLLSGWSLYITAREGLLRHETSRRASRESSLPILKRVDTGSLVVCFYICLLKADNKISYWSLPLVVVIINAVLYLFSIHLLKGGRKKKLTYFWSFGILFGDLYVWLLLYFSYNTHIIIVT